MHIGCRLALAHVAIRLKSEHEATQHTELKLTWQQANEQFLELQKTLEAKCSLLERQLKSIHAADPDGAGAISTAAFPSTAEVNELQVLLDQEVGGSKAGEEKEEIVREGAKAIPLGRERGREQESAPGKKYSLREEKDGD